MKIGEKEAQRRALRERGAAVRFKSGQPVPGRVRLQEEGTKGLAPPAAPLSKPAKEVVPHKPEGPVLPCYSSGQADKTEPPVKEPGAGLPKFDRNEYHRKYMKAYMRKRRAKLKGST